ncbi:3-carboxy-cis,cis-muconate cycloisomerase [Aliihoeflea sp. PC F10.4]
MSISPFDHPFLSGLLGDEEIGSLFAAETDIGTIVLFERALAEMQAKAGVIPADAAPVIEAKLAAFVPDMDDLREGTARDGVVIPSLVGQLRRAVGEPNAAYVHFGATSQDTIDTSLALRLTSASALLDIRLRKIIDLLGEIDTRDGQVETMAHTRMQAAIPVTASRKIASWRNPLIRHRERLADAVEGVRVLSFGGAAGTLEKLGDKGETVSALLAEHFGLSQAMPPRHSERDGVAAFASWLSLVTGSLGKMGQDIALMAQNEVGEVKLSGGGGSSAMPHKQNPVGAETLVSLARFNATLVSGMHHSLVHENERSGAAWTLEWMLLPQMVIATGTALNTALKLLDGLQFQPRH